MFTKSVAWYDAVYSWKNYEREAHRLRLLMDQHARRPITTLLDVACGTGQHITHLKPHYTVEGLDLDLAMLNLARRRHPDVTFHQGDMRAFDLGRRFDAVTCLFASVAYCRSTVELAQTVGCMAKHVNPGGLVIVEPFLGPEQFKPGYLGAIFVDRPDLKIARIHTSSVSGQAAAILFHYLVGTPDGVEHFTERHEMTMFTRDEYLVALEAAGLRAARDDEGLMGRGLYIGVRPSPDAAGGRPVD
ncbi:MAG TPA: class I SAM-dependent methyltransferase [bacterium]|nr:class I SAM-dependent methyltransferase [bacterium]